MAFEYIKCVRLMKMTDKELIQYRKTLLTHKNNLLYELDTKMRSHEDELKSMLQSRLKDRQYDLAEAQDDRENCLSSGYNIALLSIN